MMMTDKSNFDEILLIENCLKLVRKYDWIVDSYIVDFYTEKIWETRVPESWRSSLNSAKPSDLANLLDYEEKTLTHDWPLELLALRESVRQLAVPRKPISKAYLQEILGVNSKSDSANEWKCYREELTEVAGQHKHLRHVFGKHVKSKKQHEIARLADVIRTVARNEIDNLVDVGSGLGHLSRLLCFAHGFQVTCVDYMSDLSETANKFDAELTLVTSKANQVDENAINESAINTKENAFVNVISKTDANTTDKNVEDGVENAINESAVKTLENASENGILRGGPRHVTLCIDNNLSPEKFGSEIFGETIPDFGIVGLHTCGDLGPSLVRLFSECDDAKFLICVGCCYMKLDKNFPLNRDVYTANISADVVSADDVLSYSARELSCHAIEAYVERLLNAAEVEKLKVHCRRAVLEDLIVCRWPKKRQMPLRKVSNSHALPFPAYVKRATQNLGLKFDEADLVSDDVEQKLGRWNQVLSFYVLRVLLAPVIEHLVILDRQLSLKKSGFKSWIVPVFDPKLSPRNHVLLAVKK